jgi:hypothetical protein
VVAGLMGTAASATSPIVGVAHSRGEIQLNQAAVPGGATVFDGNVLRTGPSSSDVNLATGGRLLLAGASTATLHQDRALLQSGTAELSGSGRYRLDTRDLRIAAGEPATRVRVAVDGANRVDVTATGGAAEVRNAGGVLVARVLPGIPLQLRQVSDTQTRLTGTVRTSGGHFFLTDETTKVTVELRGSNLQSLVGERVRVAGSATNATPAAGATQVVQVSGATVLGSGAAGAAGAHGSGATIAVIGGVAAAATAGGLAAVGSFSGGGTTVSR